MADLPSAEQAGSAAVWFTTQAGITATVLAAMCLCLGGALVWSIKHCREEVTKQAEAHAAQMKACVDEWAKRLDNFRADVKEAFNQNDVIAEKMVTAMHLVQTELARMGGRRERESR